MMQLFFLVSCLITSMISLTMKHPLAMSLALLVQALSISMIIGLLSKTFWFSYILFLIFLGGMIVIFLYMTALASNEKFKMSMKIIAYTFILISSTLALFYFIDLALFDPFIFNDEMTSLNDPMMTQENHLTLFKMYHFPVNILTLLIISYLFLTLVAVVKITECLSGPLRKMKN